MTTTENPPTIQSESVRVRDDLARDVEMIERLWELDDRAESSYERLRDELCERPLCAEVTTTITVTLGTGGPAYGVEFDVTREMSADLYRDEPRWELTGVARVWFQDWFTPKAYTELDDHTAAHLFETWGIAYS